MNTTPYSGTSFSHIFSTNSVSASNGTAKIKTRKKPNREAFNVNLRHCSRFPSAQYFTICGFVAKRKFVVKLETPPDTCTAIALAAFTAAPKKLFNKMLTSVLLNSHAIPPHIFQAPNKNISLNIFQSQKNAGRAS